MTASSAGNVIPFTQRFLTQSMPPYQSLYANVEGRLGVKSFLEWPLR